MAKTKNKQKYPGTAAVLYLIVKIVCGLAGKQLTAFSNFKKKYTQAYLDAIAASLAAAEKMPNNKSRQAQQSDKRGALANVNTVICDLFQKLLLYIEDGFDESRWADMRKLAGADLYGAAGTDNWKASKEMQEMATDFMAKYPDELANGDMPDDFAANFGTQNTAFLSALLNFSTGKNENSGEAVDKLAANNDLYKSIQSLMRDGRRVFANDVAMQKQFSYTAQKKLLGGDAKTGFRFALREEKTLVAVTTASVEFLPSGDAFDEVSGEGVLLVHLPELKDKESYSYLLTAPGYEEVAGTLAATTGVMHRVDLILKKAVMSVEPKGEKVG